LTTGLVEEGKLSECENHLEDDRHVKLKMRNILKPSYWTITLTFALLIITSFLWRSYIIATISDTFPLGFPLQFYRAWGPCPPDESCSEFNGLWLTIDVAIWYLIRAFILNINKKRRNVS